MAHLAPGLHGVAQWDWGILVKTSSFNHSCSIVFQDVWEASLSLDLGHAS